jgi:hypothetical protein
MSRSHLGPETRAIIEAINGKKQTMEPVRYGVTTIDLTAARVNEEFLLPGEFDTVAVITITGNASIRLDKNDYGSLDLQKVRVINCKFKRFYLTNVAQPGAILVLAIGGDASFGVVAINTARGSFYANHIEVAAGAGALSLDEAITDTPTRTLDTNIAGPAAFTKGSIKRIRIRLTPTAAVTARVLILSNSMADDVYSEMVVLFDTLGVVPGGLVSGTIYDFAELDIPFILTVAATFWYIIDWSAAAGNTFGHIMVSGEAEP